jgi:hypothetical protein
MCLPCVRSLWQRSRGLSTVFETFFEHSFGVPIGLCCSPATNSGSSPAIRVSGFRAEMGINHKWTQIETDGNHQIHEPHENGGYPGRAGYRLGKRLDLPVVSASLFVFCVQYTEHTEYDPVTSIQQRAGVITVWAIGSVAQHKPG